MALIVLMFVLAVVGFLFLAGLIALVLWLVRRTQTSTDPAVASETPAPPQ